MQSLRSRILIWMIRNRHLFELKLRPEVIDEGFSVTEFRRGVDKAVDVVVEELKKMAQPVSEKDQISKVASLSAHDNEMGGLIADVMEAEEEEVG